MVVRNRGETEEREWAESEGDLLFKKYKLITSQLLCLLSVPSITATLQKVLVVCSF